MPTGAKAVTILVVDDEPALANTLAIILQIEGYIATAVYSAEEALAQLPALNPSLVVTDVIMPGMDGIALAKQIRRQLPHCRILLFSGNADTQHLLDEAIRDGYSFEILAKPVPPPQLLAKVAALLAE